MSKLIHMGTLLKRVEELEEKVKQLDNGYWETLRKTTHNQDLVTELEEKVKHLEEHYNFELRKDIEEEDNNQMPLPLEETNVLSPLQDWETK